MQKNVFGLQPPPQQLLLGGSGAGSQSALAYQSGAGGPTYAELPPAVPPRVHIDENFPRYGLSRWLATVFLVIFFMNNRLMGML